MKYLCKYTYLSNCESIILPLSKSISNRYLIAKKLSGNNEVLENISEADDTQILSKILVEIPSKINVGKAGTTFRFLASYLSLLNQEFLLDGDSRMRERPIGVLVDKLRELGATITYLGNKGYPPIQIKGGKLSSKEIEIDASVSSQFISSLLLIAPYLNNGLQIKLNGNVVSMPYIQMTLKLMQEWGIDCSFKDKRIEISKGKYEIANEYKVERDWSSAAFIYQFFAISKLEKLALERLSLNSVQGDSRLAQLFENFGVITMETAEGVELNKQSYSKEALELNLIDVPDLIPSVAVTAACLGMEMKITGVQTLHDKESNRLSALKEELSKFHIEINYSVYNLEIKGEFKIEQAIEIDTYQDHRIAMAFAPLSIYGPISINNPLVVNKSYPDFWNQIKKLGISCKELS